MMQQVNAVISRVVNGEPEEGCSGSCERLRRFLQPLKHSRGNTICPFHP